MTTIRLFVNQAPELQEHYESVPEYGNPAWAIHHSYERNEK